MPELPVSWQAIVVCLNLASIYLMLDLGPWHRPPWRTPGQHLLIWFVLISGTAMLAYSFAGWLVLYLYNNNKG
jgi:hypothetical protein